jgi:hypothetical protein
MDNTTRTVTINGQTWELYTDISRIWHFRAVNHTTGRNLGFRTVAERDAAIDTLARAYAAADSVSEVCNG